MSRGRKKKANGSEPTEVKEVKVIEGQATAAPEDEHEPDRTEKRRGRPPKPAADHNVTDDLIRQAIAEVNNCQDDIDAATGRKRAALKRYKAEGVNIDMVREALKLRKRDPADVSKDFRDLNRMLVLMELPVGTQLGLFEGVTVATAIENRQRAAAKPISTSDTIAAASEAGMKAGVAAKNRTDNPHEDGSPEFLAWDANWIAGQRQHAAKLGPVSQDAVA